MRARASGTNLKDMCGKCFVIKVVKYRSSPKDSKFFVCSVSTSQIAYSWMTLSAMISGLPLSAVRRRYMQKLGVLVMVGIVGRIDLPSG